MKPGFRPSMTWLHDWSGLVIGWLLLAIALAGTLAVFRPEIGSWTRPEVARAAVDPVESTQAAIGWLSAHAAKSPAWYLQPANDRSSTTQALWLDGNDYVTRALDPRTGSPAGIRDTLGGEFFYRFHFELQLPYPWGRILSASAAMLMVLAIITGIVIISGSFVVFIEAIQRLIHPEELPHALGMMGLAVVGIVVNGISAFRLAHGHSHNERILSWHLIEDLLAWIVVLGIVASVLIRRRDV